MMAPRKTSNRGWSQAVNEYTKDPSERAILCRLKILTSTLAITDERADLTIKQTNKRRKHLEEKAGLEIKILELTGVSAWDHLSAVSYSSLMEETKQTLQPSGEAKPPSVPAYSAPLPSEILARKLRATLQKSGARSSIRPELSFPTSPSDSSSSPTRQEAGVQLSVESKPIPQDRGYSSKGARGKMPYSTTAQAIWQLPIRQSPTRDNPEKREPPSAASGGIPNPSASYLAFCCQNPQLSSEPQKLLLVLDLNGTLLFRHNKSKSSFIERPSTQQFLNYVFEHFSVMIWSSAQLPNVEKICNKLISKHLRPRLVAIWGREHLGLNQKDFFSKVQVYKRLEKIWTSGSIQARHPQASEARYWSQANTVLIDDSQEKSRSEPHNFVRVEEFTGQGESPNVLRDLAEYLATLRMQANVSSFIRRHPFDGSPTPAAFANEQ